MHVNDLSNNKATYTFLDSSLYFVAGFVSSFLHEADAARESELKRCRFGQVSIDFECEI